MFWFGGHFVSKDSAGLGAVIWHAKVHGAIGVVPLEVDAEKYFARPIYGASVLFGEVLDEVLSIGFVDVFDSEVIYDETKMEGAGFVFEEARGTTGWDISSSFQVSYQPIV